jgi:hypothetical protein
VRKITTEAFGAIRTRLTSIDGEVPTLDATQRHELTGSSSARAGGFAGPNCVSTSEVHEHVHKDHQPDKNAESAKNGGIT